MAKQVMTIPGLDVDVACDQKVQAALALFESEPLQDPRSARWVI